jgi:sucrose phosphorylase
LVTCSTQIDIDPFSEEGWAFTEASLLSLCKNGGAKLIRLDAFGYVTKKAGTGCFMEVRPLAINRCHRNLML